VPQSVIDAIKSGNWKYEPADEPADDKFTSTDSLPGSTGKLAVLAARIRAGLPLWHPQDRLSYDEKDHDG
jgi:hypothetical protein